MIAALKHHYTNNPHHPEYHIDTNGTKLDMPIAGTERAAMNGSSTALNRIRKSKQQELLHCHS